MTSCKILFSLLFFLFNCYSNAKLYQSSTEKVAFIGYLTINSPALGTTFNPYELVPFNVTASDGTFPIVRISFDQDLVSFGVGNCSELIYARMPNDLSGYPFLVTASAVDYNPDTKYYIIYTQPFFRQLNPTTSTGVSFYKNGADMRNSTSIFNYPYNGPIAGFSIYSYTGSVSDPANLSLFEAKVSNNQQSVIFYQQNTCNNITQTIDAAFADDGAYSLTECEIYDQGSTFQPANTFSVFLNTDASEPIYMTTYPIADQVYGLAENIVIELWLTCTYIFLQVASVQAVAGDNISYSMVYADPNIYSIPTAVNVTLTCPSASPVVEFRTVTNQVQSFNITAPADATEGTCSLWAVASASPSFLGSSFVKLALSEPAVSLFITSPTAGSYFTPNSTIDVTVGTSDSSVVHVNVTLDCSGTTTNGTGLSNTTISINNVSGTGFCSIFINPVDGYTIANSTFVYIATSLTISSPLNNAEIPVGTPFNLLISGSSVGFSNVTFTCGNVVPFTELVEINVVKSVSLPNNVGNTTCTLIATSNSTEFSPSASIIITATVPTTLTTTLSGWTGGVPVLVTVSASDNAVFNLTLLTTCPASTYSQTVESGSPQSYNLPEYLNGIGCVVTTTNMPTNYLPITPITLNVAMSPETIQDTINSLNAPSFLNGRNVEPLNQQPTQKTRGILSHKVQSIRKLRNQK